MKRRVFLTKSLPVTGSDVAKRTPILTAETRRAQSSGARPGERGHHPAMWPGVGALGRAGRVRAAMALVVSVVSLRKTHHGMGDPFFNAPHPRSWLDHLPACINHFPAPVVGKIDGQT